jgi:hypothetical protein
MSKMLAGILLGLSVTAANLIMNNKNKDYNEYISKKITLKQQKWIHIR